MLTPSSHPPEIAGGPGSPSEVSLIDRVKPLEPRLFMMRSSGSFLVRSESVVRPARCVCEIETSELGSGLSLIRSLVGTLLTLIVRSRVE